MYIDFFISTTSKLIVKNKISRYNYMVLTVFKGYSSKYRIGY